VRRLYLLRHAKSSWDDPTSDDHERPLAPRGRRAAHGIAEHLRRHDITPAMVLCSSSRRTRETLEAITPALRKKTDQLIEDGLYAADAAELLDRLHQIPDDVPSVMLIGHNPGLQDLAVTLASSGRRLESLRTKFPTAALATLSIPSAGWSRLSPGDAQLEDLVVPRELG